MPKMTDQEFAQALALVKSDGRTPLTGSPKQIAWAEKLRETYIANVIQKLDAYERAGLLRTSGTDLPMVLHNALFRLRQSEAVYWIEARNDLRAR